MTAAIHTAVTRAARIGRTLESCLTVTDEHGAVEYTCTLGEMIADNLHDADTVADMLALAPGQSALSNGAGCSVITRAAT